MYMYETFLNSIPKSRWEMLNDLDIPEVTLAPYIWDPDDYLTTRSESILTASTDSYEAGTINTDSSIPLSRAMTDSEIDYGRFRRYKYRSITDPWYEMRVALDAFPLGYLDSLNRYVIHQSGSDPVVDYGLFLLKKISSDDVDTVYPFCPYEPCRWYNEEFRLKMDRFFDEECRVWTPDDPGLEALEDALCDVDMQKIIDTELDSITP